MTSNRLCSAIVLALLLAIAGCGAKLYPVQGQVVWTDGTPAKELAGGFVSFNDDAADISARGEISSAGSFSLSSLKKDDGLPTGRYQIRLAPPESSTTDGAAEAIQAARLLPEKYLSYETSGLAASVEATKNHIKLTIEKAEPQASEKVESEASAPPESPTVEPPTP
jgi:hypothetical protein